MKISLTWLTEFVDLYGFSTEDVASRLTAAGLEVEGIENPGSQLAQVVVGQIVELKRHPNADRLTLCQVDVGVQPLRQIVCGAKNHKQGDKVAVALPGAVLPGNFVIKLSKIRDVESQGMLCSESELGFKKESEGILILPPDAPVGKAFADYYCDTVLEVNVTTNRSDCLSHVGLARELAVILDRPFKLEVPELSTDHNLSTKETLAVDVLDPQLCPRYSGRVLSHVKVGPSPEFIRRRLESLGMKSINNVVDITNYVLLQTGQPLHAFDLNHIKGRKIIVGKAKPSEKFVTLDGTELTLKGDELTIRDSDRAICLAGVIGGKNSGVTDATTEIFLESASFSMASIRRTARSLGLQTESSYRFSRGTDPDGVLNASDLACALLKKYAGATIASDFWDFYPSPRKPDPINISTNHLTDRLGFLAISDEFTDWMKRIGCRVQNLTPNDFLVTPPNYRSDIEMREDLIEEYGRLKGYDKIPEELPVSGGMPLPHAQEYVFDSRLGRMLEADGFEQVVNYAFQSAQYQEKFLGSSDQWTSTGLARAQKPVMIQNPLNEEINSMRMSLAPGLFKNMVHNFRHGTTDGQIFETGYVFDRASEGYKQTSRLGLLVWGSPTGLWRKEMIASYFELKGAIETLLQKLRMGSPQGVYRSVYFKSLDWKTAQKIPPFLHPAQSAVIFCEGKNIGFVGSIHPKYLLDEKITVDAAIAEIDVETIRATQPRSIKYQPISKQPIAERDFAFLVPDNVSSASVSSEIRKIGGDIVQSVEVFDVFSGTNLPPGFRSVAYRLIVQDQTQTLNEQQLQDLQNKILAGLENKLSVRLR